MRAREFAPCRRLDSEPTGPVPTTRAQREEALRDALRGMPLGDFDERILQWALDVLPRPALRTIISWLERSRGTGAIVALEAEGALQRHHRRHTDRQDDAGQVLRGGPGLSGPGPARSGDTP